MTDARAPRLRVRAVEGTADLDAALALPERLYRGAPGWVPPPRRWWRRRVFAAIEEGRLTLFLAERGDEVVGTSSYLPDANDPELAWFGFTQAEDRPDVLPALFAAVRRRAREDGRERLRGPRDLSRFEYVGLTVEGHDRLAPLMQGHHGPWLAGAVEAAGFAPHHDVLAYETSLVDPSGRPRPLPERLLARSRALDLPRLEVRRARRRRSTADLLAAHEILEASYRSVPDVQPMPRATWMALGRAFLLVANPELVQLAFVDGQPAAFAVVLPELHEALHGTGGSLRRAWARRHLIHSVGFKLFGVRPDLRGSGLHARLVEHVVAGAQRAGYDRMDGSVIDERNGPMRAVVEGAGMEVYRRYRFYEGPTD